MQHNQLTSIRTEYFTDAVFSFNFKIMDKIDKIMEENPGMAYEFVKDILLSLQEAEEGILESYSFGS